METRRVCERVEIKDDNTAIAILEVDNIKNKTTTFVTEYPRQKPNGEQDWDAQDAAFENNKNRARIAGFHI